jgi:hypothetical protein
MLPNLSPVPRGSRLLPVGTRPIAARVTPPAMVEAVERPRATIPARRGLGAGVGRAAGGLLV